MIENIANRDEYRPLMSTGPIFREVAGTYLIIYYKNFISKALEDCQNEQ